MENAGRKNDQRDTHHRGTGHRWKDRAGKGENINMDKKD